MSNQDTFQRGSPAVNELCHRLKDSNPPVCGVHNVPLVRKQLPHELIASGYKGFTFLACPVSGKAINDEATSSSVQEASQ